MEIRIQESEEFESVKQHRLPKQDGIYQLPLVVLLCEFSRPSISRGPTILEWHEVLTLFHEMGHAMHCEHYSFLFIPSHLTATAMIGRTEYQNVAGTRCATDFVELPSILMEHFLKSPAVLSLFHVNSCSTPHAVGNHHNDPCHFIDTYTQILLATLDQVYHSYVVLNPSFDSTAELAELHSTRGLIPFVRGTSFQTQFGHLFGYGATYYSYLFDHAIASRVWTTLFAANPLDRLTGQKYRKEVLRHGGRRDPWKMVSALLNSPHLEVGDTEAMRQVGHWRLEHEVGLAGRH
jgi:intermediate peptidase